MKFTLSWLLLVLFSTSSFALSNNLNETFEVLKNSKENYKVVGAVCEQVARLEMQEKYPAPNYKVHTGIVYKVGERVVGELDVVVMDTQKQKAIWVSEVKCWRDLSAGLNKAYKQRKRFISNLEGGNRLEMYCSNRRCKYTEENFKGLNQFQTYAQKGAKQFGYDQELPYTLDELMGLRERLIECQERGECASPY